MIAVEGLFRGISDGICVSDVEGNVLYMNPSAERLLGVEEGQSSNEKMCDLLCGRLSCPGTTDCASSCPLRQAGSPQKAVVFQGKHGLEITYGWTEKGIKRVEWGRNLRVRCLRMPTDFFDGHETEKRFTVIEDATADMELERRKEDWRNMVAHDLRSPLINIFGALRVLEDVPSGRPLAEGERNLIQIGVKACRRMTELLDLFLDMAQLDAGLMPLHIMHIDLLETAKKCVEEQSPMAQSKHIQVALDVPQDLTVRADQLLLFRVIQNVLNNALKFTPESGHVTISAEGEADTVILRIKDTGPGIAAEHLSFLFDRFYQTRTRKQGLLQGHGLGLAFCQEALKAMGGTIEAESTPGRGSEFIVRLPSGLTAATAVVKELSAASHA